MSVVAASTRVRIAVGPLAGKIYEFQNGLRIGRHPFNEMSLSDPGVSRYHCWITIRDGAPTLEDLASANGTFVNGERIKLQRVLVNGDRIRIGFTEFEFSE